MYNGKLSKLETNVCVSLAAASMGYVVWSGLHA